MPKRQEADPYAPLVTMVMSAHERPHFFPIALRCYQHQAYRHRELIVIDDGSEFPVDEAAVVAAGGRLLRAEPGTPLGSKLNLGIAEARGTLCVKMDDDDYYGPQFVARMVQERRQHLSTVCRPVLTVAAPFFYLDLLAWQIRRSINQELSGATLLFSRDDWEEHPFRPLPRTVDTWFIIDQTQHGATIQTVPTPDFLQMRHTRHLWSHQRPGVPMDGHLTTLPLHEGGPEALLPQWAVTAYREVQQQLAGAGAGNAVA